MVDHSLYVEFWSQFSNIAQVIFLDQRGCGRSDKRTAAEWNLQCWADDLFQFCQTLNIEKPILAGVSMGGHVICEYLRHHADNTSGLIFCNTEARFIINDVCNKLTEIAGTDVAKIARKQLTNPTPNTAKAYQEKCVKYYAKNAYSPTEIGRCIQHIEILSHFYKNHLHDFNYLEDLKKINCPTLFMVGELSPFHLPIRAEEMALQIESKLVTMHIFKNAGAPVYKDAPAESAMVVRNFLKKKNMKKSTERFTYTVEDYVKYRPSYPVQVLETMVNECGLTKKSIIADVCGIESFFAPNFFNRKTFPNLQKFDWTGLPGRLRSGSHTPTQENPDYLRMIEEMKNIFEQHQKGGFIDFLYRTELYYGQIYNI